MQRRFRGSFFGSLQALVLICGLGTAAAEPVQVKMATLAPLNTPWMDAWSRAEEIISERSPVPMKLTAYAGGVMGDEPDIVRKLKFNQIQMIGVTVVGLSKLVPEALVLTLPFMYENIEEVNHIVKTFTPRLEQYARERGFRLLHLDADGEISTFSINHVKTPEQFKQQKVWIWTSDPVSMRMAEVMGVEGVLLGVPEVRVGLQTGMINTIFGSPLILVAMQWHNQVKYHYPDPVAYGVGAMVGRDDMFDAVPEGKRAGVTQVFKDALKISGDEMKAKSRQIEAEMLQTLLDEGIKQVTSDVDETIMKDAESAAKDLWVDLAGEYYPRELLDDVVAELEAFRAQQVP